MTAIPKPDNLPEAPVGDNARVVLTKRYLQKDPDGNPVEGVEDLFWRVASAIAAEEAKYGQATEAVEETARRFYDLMTSLRFLPNSPTLMNAGTPLGQLAACFVLPVGDSMEEIFDAVKYAALIHKSGGGTGFSFSRLRPKKSRVGSTGGVASGPVSFMRIFNTATEQVKQGGTRRGANMGILRVDHPDILEFITCKERESELQNFNISVAVTERFMQAVEKGEDYDLIDPRDGKPAGKRNAEEVFSLLVRKAWESGDPGIVFLDRINRDNPTPALGDMESTNPCVTGDTWVMTADGPRQARELTGRAIPLVIDGMVHASTNQGFFVTGQKPVFRLRTKEGHTLRLTADHRLLRAASGTGRVGTEWVAAGELAPGDRLVLGDHRGLAAWPGKYGLAEGYLVGLLLGDGTLKQDKAVLSFWTRAQAANGDPFPRCGVMEAAFAFAQTQPHRSDFTGWSVVSGRNEWRMSLGALKTLCRDLGMAPGRKRITPEVERCSSEFSRGLLGGLFDADGSVQGSQAKGVSIRLAQSDLETLRAVQRMLLRHGIAATIYAGRRQAGESLLPDGKGVRKAYPIRDQHELVVSGENLARFREVVGFRDQDKAARLDALLGGYKRRLNQERFLATFEELTPDGEETVFDVQVPGQNRFDANGLSAHNCGEQPLLPYEACNLGSINLSRFHAPKAKDGIDWAGLKETVHLAVRFLDDVIDASRYPLEQITEMVHINRKIGLGVMGFADLLYLMRIPYDSAEALALGEKLMERIQSESKAASQVLAEERGPFPAYPDSIYSKRNLGPYRNATTTTIAPTGTLSIIAGCSSGIEPLFALAFSRHVMDGEKLVEANPYFLAAMHQAGAYSDTLLEEVTRKGSIAHIQMLDEELRRVFVTAMDIEPVWHLKMQAAFQKYTDNAVSKTVNLPNSATKEDIRHIYELAYGLGCKGVTVYRSGCKSNQVLCTGETGQAASGPAQSRVRTRPDVVFGFTQKVKTGLGELYLTVNEIDGKPFEVFATIGKSGRSVTAKAEAIGRLVSLALRSGVDVADIVGQLKGIGGENPVFQKKGLLLSIPDAVSWVLENRYLQGKIVRDDTGNLGHPQCPDCGTDLVFEEGCHVCKNCGFTKCG